MINVIDTKLTVGAAAPFKALHLADTHLIYADMRDGERKVELARSRIPYFPVFEEAACTAAAMAKAENIPILHSGDFIDFVSAANLEAAARYTAENDCFVAAGNHDFSLYLGEAKEDAAYRNRSLAAVQKAFRNDIRMDSRVINGVNFVALDDGYYLFEKEQLDFLRTQVAKGLPIVLLLHVPLYEPTLYDLEIHAGCAYLTAVPEERMRHYPPERYEQQRADETTRETVRYIESQPLIRAVLAGHIHKNTYTFLAGGRLPQITTDCPDIRRIEFV